MKEFLFEWGNGKEKVKGKDYKDACSKIKRNPDKIQANALIRFKPLASATKEERKERVWKYLSNKMFWTYLKKEKVVLG